MRQPFRPLFVVPGTVFTVSGMADGYDNTMQSLIGGLAAQAATAGGRRSSAGHRAAVTKTLILGGGGRRVIPLKGDESGS